MISLVSMATILAANGAIYWKLHKRFGKIDARMSDVVGRVRAINERVARSENMLRQERAAASSRNGELRKEVNSVRTGITKELQERLRKFAASVESAHLRTQMVLRDDQIQAGYVSALAALYPGWPVFMGGPALDGYTARALFDQIVRLRPRAILELGSGSSTVLIASLLTRLELNETRHISVDDGEEYLEATRKNLERHQLQGRTELWHCPIEERGEGLSPWYSGIIERLGDQKLDLILVDGPPGVIHPSARQPALELLRNNLSEGGVVILDDTMRAEEASIAASWKERFPELRTQESRRGKGFTLFCSPTCST